jgi:hypothetical protein
VPEGSFIERLGGDVGGPPHCSSSSTPGDSSSSSMPGGSSSSDSSGYNDECPHIKEVSSYELLIDFNCLVQLLNVHVHFQIQKLEKKLVVAKKEFQQVR